MTLEGQAKKVVSGEWGEILALPTAHLKALVDGLEKELKQREKASVE